MDELEQAKGDILKLWALLDDISTYGDMFKPEITRYFEAVNRKADGRFAVCTSDGYKVFYHGEDLTLVRKILEIYK